MKDVVFLGLQIVQCLTFSIDANALDTIEAAAFKLETNDPSVSLAKGSLALSWGPQNAMEPPRHH